MFYLLVAVIVILNILFYGFGQCCIDLGAKEIEQLSMEEHSKKAERIVKICNKPTAFVRSLHFVTVVGDVCIGIYLGLLYKSVQPDKLIATGLILFTLLICVGEMFAKKFAHKYRERFAYVTVNLIYFLSLLLTPVTWIMYRISCIIAFCFGIREEHTLTDVTEEEIISMVNEGREQGVLQASEVSMINNIFKLDDMEAQDIMTNRKNIIAIDGEMVLGDAIHFMLKEGKSRCPVYQEDIDHIIGILNFRDAINAQDDSNSRTNDIKLNCLKGLLREPVLIPETRNIDTLFKNMQSSKTQMVIVVDEYGQTAGLVTMEDILEEIVGNIMDEYDKDEGYIEKRQNYILVNGLTPLEVLEDKLGVKFEDDRFETINGYFISQMQHIPSEGEDFSIQLGDYNLEIYSVKNKIIEKIKVTKVIAI